MTWLSIRQASIWASTAATLTMFAYSAICAYMVLTGTYYLDINPGVHLITLSTDSWALPLHAADAALIYSGGTVFAIAVLVAAIIRNARATPKRTSRTRRSV